MNRPGRAPRHGGALADTLESLLTAAAVVLMLASMGCVAVLVVAGFSAPRVGDVIMFRPGTPVDMTVNFEAHRTGTGAGCVLDPDVMVNGGGSLVVEARSRLQSAYQVHWAGGRTADGTSDCGRSADLMVNKSDLLKLVNVMGGRGIAGRGDVF